MTKESKSMNLSKSPGTEFKEYRVFQVKDTDFINPKYDVKEEMESDEEKLEKGWSDMTETEASDSEDDSKLVIDTRGSDLSSDSHSHFKSRSPTLEDTVRFLNGNLKSDIKSDESDDSENEIVVSSSGAPDRFQFLTEIFVPKMRGFEELSDRCILDSVSISLTLDQVVKSTMEQFNNILKNTDLTDTQLEITKYVRRRARNRVAARRSRMKKQTDILTLMTDIREIRKRKGELREKKILMEDLKKELLQRVHKLQQLISQKLKNIKGENVPSLNEFEELIAEKKNSSITSMM